jgi:amino acid adenylation domain-containing protein
VHHPEELVFSAPPEATPAAAGLLSHLSPRSRREFWDFGVAERIPPRTGAIHDPFMTWAAAHPDDPAVEDAEGRRLSYGDLDRRSRVLASRLHRLGVRRGDRVGLFLSRSPEMIVGILGILRAGAAWVPQDARHATGSTLEHIVAVAGIDVVLTTARHADAVPAAVGHVVVLDGQDRPTGSSSAEPEPAVGEPGTRAGGDDVAVVIFTSGTTGVPNGVAVTHANLVNTVVDGPAALGIGPGMRVGQILNIAFDMAVWEIFGALTHGATLVVRGRDLPATAACVDVLIATPSVLASLDPAACAGVRIVAVAGERCPEPLARTWSRFTAFHNSCGPTEVTIVNTVHRLAPGDQLTIGAPIPNTTVYVLDEDLRPVETGAVGEMWAGGACVTRGYLGNPELTAERYRPDPFVGGLMFRTRDLVSWTADGRLLHHGRTDDQVKVRGGFRVELDAVTAALEHGPGVLGAVTLLRDGALVGVVAAAAESEAERDRIADGARRAVAERHAYYYVPQEVVVVRELPLTSRGKVDRRALLARLDAVEVAA